MRPVLLHRHSVKYQFLQEFQKLSAKALHRRHRLYIAHYDEKLLSIKRCKNNSVFKLTAVYR